MGTVCLAYWFQFFTVEGCIPSRKERIFFLSFDQAKTSQQLDKH
jgi:hypothetical protein